MGKSVTEIELGTLPTYVNPDGVYDPNKLGLPSLMVQKSGGTSLDNWAGPIPNGVARPVETSAAIPGVMPFVINYSPTEDWVFFADNAAVAATRRVQMYTFNKLTSLFSWKGFVTLSFPFAGTQGTYTVRSFRMTYDLYTTGTASASGTSVTGQGTSWTTNRVPSGCRIGFGSTDPTEITTWYTISSVDSNTGITLASNAGTIADGDYVIEDLRAILLLTNAVTTTNGGLFSAKGLSYDAFSPVGTSISAATTIDNIRAVYWHTDAATNTNIVGIGMGLSSTKTFTQRYVYVLDTLVNPYCFKFDLRASLTPTAGKDTNAFVLKTGLGGAVTGAISQTNNARAATAEHGGGEGEECLYFTTATRVYRTAPVSSFSSGSTTWLSGGDVMTEVPPGGTSTQAAFATLNSIEYLATLDKFIITTTSATGGRHYITQYRTDGGQIDRTFLVDTKQLNQTSASSDIPIVPSTVAVVPTIWAEGGMAYLATTGTTAVTNFVFSFPIGVDWEYVARTNQRLILPKMSTLGATSFSKVFANFLDVQGSTTGYNLGFSTEGVRLLYRTAGIDDNSGAWTIINGAGELDGVGGSDYIQFAAEFKLIGLTCLPSRLYNIAVTYNKDEADGHYQPSVGNSSIADNQFAWRMANSWGGTVPTLYVKLYNVANGLLLNEDDTVTQDGTWEKSTNGGSSWGAYDTADKTNEITYIRYTPSALSSGVRVRAILTS